MTNLRYPIGDIQMDPQVTEEKRRHWIDQIAETPDKLRVVVEGLSQEPMDTPYRPGGWTVRQVTHHLPDSDLNAYVRFHPLILPALFDTRSWAFEALTPPSAWTPASART